MRASFCRSWLLACVLSVAASGVRAQSDDPWLGRDKLLHFSVSLGITAATYTASVPLFERPWQRALLAVGVGLSLGVAKELYDATGHGDPSWRDLTWDVLGCAAGVGLALLVDVSLRRSPRAPPARALLLRF